MAPLLQTTNIFCRKNKEKERVELREVSSSRKEVPSISATKKKRNSISWRKNYDQVDLNKRFS
jgi:hypothetical protein